MILIPCIIINKVLILTRIAIKLQTIEQNRRNRFALQILGNLQTNIDIIYQLYFLVPFKALRADRFRGIFFAIIDFSLLTSTPSGKKAIFAGLTVLRRGILVIIIHYTVIYSASDAPSVGENIAFLAGRALELRNRGKLIGNYLQKCTIIDITVYTLTIISESIVVGASLAL